MLGTILGPQDIAVDRQLKMLLSSEYTEATEDKINKNKAKKQQKRHLKKQ